MPEGVLNEEMVGPEGLPSDKAADFGNHAHKYYKIPHSIFKSNLDNSLFESLFSSYWAYTLSQNRLEINRTETSKMIQETNSKMRKYFSDPKSFKHESKSDADFERGGGQSKKTS